MTALALLAALGKSLLFTLAGILPIINPLASAPIFVDLNRDLSEPTRQELAWSVGKNVMLLLAGAMFAGSYVLHFFGVSLPVVRVAGGMVVASISWRMLNAQPANTSDAAQMASVLTEDKAKIKAFYPITFPLTCGPGTMAVSIAIGASLFTRESVYLTMANLAGGLVACVLMGFLVALTYRYASRLLRYLGETGQIVFTRLMAFILLCVGVEIFWSGARALISSLEFA